MTETDPARLAGQREQETADLADQREREVEELQRRSHELEDRAGDVREDWERKRADPHVPGAQPAEGDEAEQTGSPAPEGTVGPPADSGEGDRGD